MLRWIIPIYDYVRSLPIRLNAVGISLTRPSVRNQSLSITILSCLLGAALIAFAVPASFADDPAQRLRAARAIAHHIMGSICDLHGLTVQAAGEYQQAIVYDPASPLTRFRLGTNLTRLGRFDDAIEQLKKIPDLDPQDVQSRYLLALIYSSQKKFDNAASEYETILKSLTNESPDNVDLYYYLGQLYYARRDFAKAIEQFEKILTLQPQNTEMMYFLGALYVDVERQDKAIEVFKKALEIDPDHDGILNSLGYIYAEQGNDLEEAMTLIKRALAVSPDSAAYLDSLGWVYFKQGRYDEALTILLKASERMKDPVILGHIGDVYLALKKPQDAEEYWKRSLALDPEQRDLLEKIERLKYNSTDKTSVDP